MSYPFFLALFWICLHSSGSPQYSFTMEYSRAADVWICFIPKLAVLLVQDSYFSPEWGICWEGRAWKSARVFKNMPCSINRGTQALHITLAEVFVVQPWQENLNSREIWMSQGISSTFRLFSVLCPKRTCSLYYWLLRKLARSASLKHSHVPKYLISRHCNIQTERRINTLLSVDPLR